jgi:hypothetical protein
VLRSLVFFLGCRFTLVFFLEVLLGKVDDLHGVDLLLAQDSKQPQIFILLELVPLPGLDSSELGSLAHLDPLAVDQLLVVDMVVVVLLRGTEYGRGSQALLVWVAIYSWLGWHRVIAPLPPGLAVVYLLLALIGDGPLFKLLDGLEVEVLVLVGEIHLLKGVVFGADLHFQRHQGVVQQPVLRVKGHLVLPLNEGDVRTNVELVLELAHQLEKHLLLLDEPKFRAAALGKVAPPVLFYFLIRGVFGVQVLIFFVGEQGPEIILLLDVLANLEVLVFLLLEPHEAGLVVARNDHGQIKVSEGVQKQNLLLRVVLQIEVVQLWILELLILLATLVDAFRIDFSQNVLEEECDRRRDQVLEYEWWRDGQVPHRNELCLLGVEVHVAANAVDVRIHDHEYLVVVALNVGIFSEHFGFKHHWLLLENLRLLLLQRDLRFRSPLEFLVASVQSACGLLLVLEVVDRSHLYLIESASPQRYHD